MISIHKKYKTRDGRPVELVTTGGRGKWPVLGYVGTPVEGEFRGGCAMTRCATSPAVQAGEDVNVRKCHRCDVEMTSGIAVEQTYVSGSPDFPSDAHAVTFSAGGPGRLITCWKCPSCGFSVTASPSRDAKVLQQRGEER